MVAYSHVFASVGMVLVVRHVQVDQDDDEY